MKTKQPFLILLLIAYVLPMQSQVTFRIDSLPEYTPENDQIYIALSMNGYKNGDPEYAMHKNQDGKWEITVNPRAGYPYFYYYFNRGSWQSWETDSLEHPINHRYTFSTPETVGVTVYNWWDHEEKPTTAAWNVSRISRNFPMPQLDNNCWLSIYLPPDYQVSGKSYPVIYMQDGVELFDDYTSWGPEWKVDETLNELASQGAEVPIVVGIDNGDDRKTVYPPWDYWWQGIHYNGLGEYYIDFLTNTLKPYIDSAYRTLPGPENTCIMGSSFGGLISFYGAIKRPDVFRKAGIFSPSYWVSDSVWTFLRDAEKVHPMRLYQLIGSTEQEDNMIDNMLGMHELLGNMGYTDEEIKYKIVEGGIHASSLWGPEFREAYLWLFPEASSSSGQTFKQNEVTVYPNPTRNTLYINHLIPIDGLEIQIYNMTGASVYPKQKISGNMIDISNLPKGMYFLKITGGEIYYSGKFIKQ